MNILVLLGMLVPILIAGEVTLRWIIGPNTLKFHADDELLWECRPNQVATMWMGWGSFRSPVTSANELGFRGPSWTKHSHRCRIIVLGDSLAFGTRVLNTQAISYWLGKLLEN